MQKNKTNDIKVKENRVLKETIYMKTLPSGLRCYIIPKKGFVEKQAIFATHYGSIDNKFAIEHKEGTIEVPDGIAHFLEHKMFEEEWGNIFDEFSKLGSAVNAYTNFTTTAYYFSCTDHFDENLKLLLEFVQRPYFTDENVEKEKGIIGQEIHMYDDDPDWKVFFNGLAGMYHDHPVKKNIAGSIASIAKIDKELLYTCYKTFYHPSNMAVICVGDLEPEKTLEEIQKYIKNCKPQGEIKRIYPEEPTSIQKNEIEEAFSISQPMFQIVFKENHVGFDGEELCKREVQSKVLLNMLAGPSSSLYQRLYAEGLVDDTFGYEYVSDITFGHSMIGGNSKDPKKIQELLRAEIEGLQKNGLPKEDFARVKKKLIGRFIRTFNSIDSIANGQVALCFKGLDLFDYADAYFHVTVEDVENRLKEHLQLDKMVLSIVVPR